MLGRTTCETRKTTSECKNFLDRKHVIVIKTKRFSGGVRQASGKNGERVIFRVKTACGFWEVTLERLLPKRINVIWGSGGDAAETLGN